MQTSQALILALVLGIVLLSCSSQVEDPVSTGNGLSENEIAQTISEQAVNIPNTWGIWEIVLDPDTRKAEILPLRHAMFTSNQNSLMAPSQIQLVITEVDELTGIVDLDIGLSHPFPGLTQYVGFDVMGIFMSYEPVEYVSGEGFKVAAPQNLLNSDGWTRWFNATEFSEAGDLNGLLGYKPGELGSPAYNPIALFNPYKYYADGLGKNEDEFDFLVDNADGRGAFMPGSTNWRHYKIHFPDLPQTGKAAFQYAIAVHWEPNTYDPKPPQNGLDDFPPEANADEAVVCGIVDSSTVWYDGSDFGGNVILDISPWDWSAQCVGGTMDEYEIKLYSVAWENGGGKVVDTSCTGENNFYETFHADFPVDIVDSGEPLEVVIAVIYPELDYTNEFGVPNIADGPLINVFLVEIDVASEPVKTIEVIQPNGSEEIWWGDDYEITWTSENITGPVDIEYSKDDFVSDINTIATGEIDDGNYLWEDVPVDISDTVKVRVSSVDFPGVTDESDDYFRIVDHGWARTWGSAEAPLYGTDVGTSVIVDNDGNVYVAGCYEGTVDFDPGPDEYELTSVGGADVFLCSYDQYGSFRWAHSWGSAVNVQEDAWNLDVDDEAVYVVGGYQGTADFDPGDGEDIRTSEYWDSFLCKYTHDGEYIWTLTWGGPLGESCYGLRLDDQEGVYVTGKFSGTVDLDPGPGVDWHTAPNGWGEIYLSKFSTDATFQWAKSWGGTNTTPNHEVGWSVACDSSSVYVTGTFFGTADFDPGPGEEYHTSNGSLGDVFLTCFNPDGEHQWAKTWGGSDADGYLDMVNATSRYDCGWDVAIDTSGNVWVKGEFTDVVDFDPGPGVFNLSSNGDADIFIAKYTPVGEFLWAGSWGGDGWDRSWHGLDITDSGIVYVAGHTRGSVDFDPGPGFEPRHSTLWTGFLSAFEENCEFQWVTMAGVGRSVTYDVCASSEGYPYVAGGYKGTMDLDPGPGIKEFTAGGSTTDAYLIKYMPDGYW